MRIQHNIMAMNAYRNYTNNVSAMKANLEKLSSGYKINRAGDDAAGLAISEKMRAQITGLETAQKNAKDGISLVQTAEGALTEVHDMLNRMVELATQSANGTYDNTTDRYQLQKEIEQLRSEINRIADSSNFNGIKLLDGSMSTDAAKVSGDARIISEVYTTGNAAELSGTRTFLDGEVPTQEVKTVFDVDFTGLTAKQGSTNGTFTAGTATNAAGAVNQTITNLDFTGTATLTDAQVTALKAATLNFGGGCTVSFTDLDIDNTTTAAEAKTAITNAIAAQVAKHNADGAAGTANYTKVEYDATKLQFTNAGGFGLTAADITLTPQTYAPDTDMEFTFKIGDTDFTAKLEGIDTADATTTDASAIAKAAFVALGGDAANLTTAVTAQVNGINYDVTCAGSKLTFTLKDDATDENVAANYDWDVIGNKGDYFDGNHTAGVKVTIPGTAYKDAPLANTVFKIETGDIKDGTTITIDGTTVTLAVGKNSKFTNAAGKIDLTWMEENAVDLDKAISAISKGFAGDTTNFIVGVNDTSNGDTHPGLTVHKKATSTEKYTTKAQLASVFELSKPAGGGLTLQIGDTADTYNQLKVSIKDCHAAALGLSAVDISTQEGATKAVEAIKTAINTVSDVRGTLGATQNRLDHTINNLSVMTENIQDAESTIRDTDVAEEMMAYTKNNILIQSAQAMLAQANQVPQGVLQLLQ